MKKVQKTLMVLFIVPIVIALLLVVIFETGILTKGTCDANANGNFIMAALMELFTLIGIPTALRLFKFGIVERDLKQGGEKSLDALKKWGTLRIGILVGLLLANTILYYIFMNTAFGYMAIVCFFALFFVYPSYGRCLGDINTEDNTDIKSER